MEFSCRNRFLQTLHTWLESHQIESIWINIKRGLRRLLSIFGLLFTTATAQLFEKLLTHNPFSAYATIFTICLLSSVTAIDHDLLEDIKKYCLCSARYCHVPNPPLPECIECCQYMPRPPPRRFTSHSDSDEFHGSNGRRPVTFNQGPPNFNRPPQNANRPPPNFNPPPQNTNGPQQNFDRPPQNFNPPPPPQASGYGRPVNSGRRNNQWRPWLLRGTMTLIVMCSVLYWDYLVQCIKLGD